MANMRTVFAGCLMLAGLSWGSALAETPPTKGIPVEVQTQNNDIVKFELREVVPSYNDSDRMSFTKGFKPKLSQFEWLEVPIVPGKRGLRIREIRIADEGQKIKDATDGKEYTFYSIVIVPYEGATSSWYWQATSLSGVTIDTPPRPISIPVSNIKVVRFPKPPAS